MAQYLLETKNSLFQSHLIKRKSITVGDYQTKTHDYHSNGHVPGYYVSEIKERMEKI